MLMRAIIPRIFFCYCWIVVAFTLCKSTQNISSSLESVNITRLLKGDQFPNPECPLRFYKIYNIGNCDGIGIRRGCSSTSLVSNYCTKSKGICVDLKTCCFCRCPSALPTFLSQGDNSKACVSNNDLPNYIPHVRYPVCRYRMVARHGSSSCRNATVPVLDVTKPGSIRLDICIEDFIHRARVVVRYHDVNLCQPFPSEVKYLLNGLWHNLSSVHLGKFETHKILLPSPIQHYVSLKWSRALGKQFSGLLFSMKTTCTVMEPNRVVRVTDVCLLFKAAGTYKKIKRSFDPTPPLIHTRTVSEESQIRNQSTVLSRTSASSSAIQWKTTTDPPNMAKESKPTKDVLLEKVNGEDSKLTMIIALSCALALVCVVVILGVVFLARRYRRKTVKDRDIKGNALYDVPSEDLHPAELGTENTYEALRDCTRSSRGQHIYQSLNTAETFVGSDYMEPIDKQQYQSQNSLKDNLTANRALPKTSSFSDREVGGYAEPDHDRYPVADFIEDAPVPVNAKRLPGYYEPACIILGNPPKTLNPEWPSNGHVTNGQNSRDYGTPQYFVLEETREV